MSTEHGLTVCLEHLASILRQPDPTLSEFRADSLGVKCCSHTLLLHAWVSVRTDGGLVPTQSPLRQLVREEGVRSACGGALVRGGKER